MEKKEYNKPTGKEIVEQIFPYIDEKLRGSDLTRLYRCIESAMESYAQHLLSEKVSEWIAVETKKPDEVKRKYWVAIFDSGQWGVYEAVYMLFDKKEWLFCNPADGWQYVFQPTHYMAINKPAPPKQVV